MSFTLYNEPVSGATTAEIATDNFNGLRYQQMKLDIGAPGVSIPLTGTLVNGVLVDISRVQGTVAVTQSTSPWVVSGGIVLGASLPAGTNNIGIVTLAGGSIDIGLVDQGVGNAAGSPWSVSGNISILGTPTVSVANQPTFNQGVGNAAGSPWSVSGTISVGNFPATQIVSGGVTVSNFPTAQAVTQSTMPWVVSGGVVIGAPLPTGSNTIGTVTANQGTTTWTVSGGVVLGASLPAGTNIIGKVSQDTSPWITSGGVTVSNFPVSQTIAGTVTSNQGTPASSTSAWPVRNSDNFVTTTFTASGQTLIVPTSGCSTVFATVSGSTSTVIIEGTGDGVNWGSLQSYNVSGTIFASNSNLSFGIVSNYLSVPCGGLSLVRLRCSAYGTNCLASLNAGAGTFYSPIVSVTQGTGNAGGSPWAVSGTVIANAGTGTFIISGGVVLGAALPAGSSIIGKVSQDTSPWVISGGVVIGAPLPAGTNNIGTVTLASSSIDIGKVDQGTGNASTSPWSVSGTVAVTQSTSTWTVSGGVVLGAAIPAGSAIIGKVSQDTSPWIVGGPSASGSVANTLNPFLAGAVSPTNLLRNLHVDSSDNLNVNIATTTTVTANAGTGTFITSGGVVIGAPLPTGTNTIGTVTANQGTTTWIISGGVVIGAALPTGTNSLGTVGLNTGVNTIGFVNQGAQSNNSYWSVSGQVSQVGTWNVGLNTGANTIGSVSQDGGNGGVSPWAVSGTVSVGNTPSVNQGTSPWVVSGPTASGSVFTANPQLIAGASTDGKVRTLLTDATGILQTSAVLSATTVTSNQGTGNAAGSPWSVSGTITANAGTGNFLTVGADASGSVFTGNPQLVAGADTAAVVRTLLTDTRGRQIVVGGAASGTAAGVINPVLMGAADGSTNLQALSVDGQRNLNISVRAGGGTNTASVTTLSDGANNNTIGIAVLGLNNLFNGSTWDRLRTPNKFFTASITASGNNVIWTPTSGKKFRLMGYYIEISDNSNLSAGAVVTLQWYDANATIGIAHATFIPTTSVTTTAGAALVTGDINLGNGYLSSAADNKLSLNLSATFSAGSVRCNARGTEE